MLLKKTPWVASTWRAPAALSQSDQVGQDACAGFQSRCSSVWRRRSSGERSGSAPGDELGRADRKHVLLEQERRREARELARAPADERVRGAGLERFIDRIGVDQHVGLGMARLELADPADEPGGGERRRRIDHQKAAPLALAHRARGLGEQRESFGERSCSGRARFGQPKSAAVSLDEPCADILLERPHLLGDRGLGHVQFLAPRGRTTSGARRPRRRAAR